MSIVNDPIDEEREMSGARKFEQDHPQIVGMAYFLVLFAGTILLVML